ncbi:hypothetical protein [Thalassotalea profundi]|uniref:RiboL-PSP-HEPN domain-containing protein n=1 Tax=Thalassotalea profundi TaxID=2036687 RepID=A0ABQ3IHT1_9GAMM|nr:hypothetical protein [Thalassotalea profundi]GHE82991.1 hypothetical protein GCM10011501_09180 [Thalassotalea profundi]
MKAISLPKAIPIRFYLDGEKPKSISSGSSLNIDLDIIEKNTSEIISAAIMLEDRMVEAVSKILFGLSKDKKERRDFFTNEIMGTSDFSYAFKRRVFTRLLEQMNLLPVDKIKILKSGLNKVMGWRNAFAHGTVLHEHGAGYMLQYYSGGHKEVVLDDAYFENIELTIRECLYICNGVIQA